MLRNIIARTGIPAQALAVFAGVVHMALLGAGTVIQIAVSPAQAATLHAFGSATHTSLLVFSGTAAAFFAILAGQQSKEVQSRVKSKTGRRKKAGNIQQSQDNRASKPRTNDQQGIYAQNIPGPAGMSRDWSELMARTSHDLRTPLNAVIGFTDVMHRELLGPIGHDRYREYIGHIRDASMDLLKSSESTLAITAAVTDLAGKSCDTYDLAAILSAASENVSPCAPDDRTLDAGSCPLVTPYPPA